MRRTKENSNYTYNFWSGRFPLTYFLSDKQWSLRSYRKNSIWHDEWICNTHITLDIWHQVEPECCFNIQSKLPAATLIDIRDYMTLYFYHDTSSTSWCRPAYMAYYHQPPYIITKGHCGDFLIGDIWDSNYLNNLAVVV